MKTVFQRLVGLARQNKSEGRKDRPEVQMQIGSFHRFTHGFVGMRGNSSHRKLVRFPQNRVRENVAILFPGHESAKETQKSVSSPMAFFPKRSWCRSGHFLERTIESTERIESRSMSDMDDLFVEQATVELRRLDVE